jgi:protein required for attachment to host cells
LTKNEVPAHAIVAVCDARKAIILRNEGDAEHINLKVLRTVEAPENPPTHLQGDARPGRTAMGSRRSALEETDWHRRAEAAFAASVATALVDLPDQPRFILVAPPAFLGDLRKQLPSNLAGRIIAEHAKDWTHLPAWELERALANARS